jgi:hypothetical protein
MARALALILGTVLLSGCADPIYSYSKPGGNLADFKQDSYACVQDSRLSSGVASELMSTAAQVDTKRDANLYRMCMEARGWMAE